MTEIFAYGSINMTDIFGITDESQVSEKLRPYLYHSKNGKWYLNVIMRNLQQEGKFGSTHSVEASSKSIKGTVTLAELKEFVRKDSQTQQRPAQQQSPEIAGNYSNIDLNF